MDDVTINLTIKMKFSDVFDCEEIGNIADWLENSLDLHVISAEVDPPKYKIKIR